MKKKYLALALAASMVVSTLAGCGSNNASTGDTPANYSRNHRRIFS